MSATADASNEEARGKAASIMRHGHGDEGKALARAGLEGRAG